jgi:drug/metabolite transporter (DMT)-like permease
MPGAARRVQARGRLAAALGGACFGTLGPFSKLFYERGGSASELISIRVVGTAAVLGTAVALRRRLRIGRGPLIFALALGLPQLGQNYALLEGFSRAPASLVILLFYIYPLVVCVGERVIFGEALDAPRVLALLLGATGIALTVGRPATAPLSGVLLGAGAGLCTAAYILAARHFFTRVEIQPTELIALMYVVPAVALIASGAATGFSFPVGTGWAWATAVLAVSSVLAMLFFYTGIQLTGAGVASLLATVEPFVAVVMAYLMLHESLSLRQLFGGALILAAVLSLTTLRARRQPLDNNGITTMSRRPGR